MNQHSLLELKLLMFEKYMSITSDGIVGIDKDGRICLVNDSYCNFFDINRDEVLGEYIKDIIPSSKMMDIVKNNITEIDVAHYFDDICNGALGILTSRAAIFNQGKTVGGIAQVRFARTTTEFANQLNKLQPTYQYYQATLSNRRAKAKAKYTINTIYGSCPKMAELKQKTLKIAQHNFSVLILGETGTGKEVFAHAIHNESPRALHNFIKVNCAAIPSELLESELFGYEEGAFSGARKGGKPGKIELAHNGTLFLDEIAELPLAMQAKLLRVLQDNEVDRLGCIKSTKVDIRIIAATNKNLEEMVKEQTFREDLYYRLNIIELKLPPLRERSQDIIPLALHFLNQHNEQYEQDKFFSPDAERCLINYCWSGNIRELQNIIAQAFVLADNRIIDKTCFPMHISLNKRTAASHIYANKKIDLKTTMKRLEKEVVLEVIKMTKGNHAAAAKLLNINRGTLYKKLKN